MQIALQDIRILGYKKIIKIYLNESVRSTFFDSIDYLNTLCNSIKIPAYSLLNKWYLLDEIKNSKEIEGYSLFIYNIESMIDLEAPSNSAKRKCRNVWNSIWDNFGAIASLEDYQIITLKEFGLRVLFLFASINTKNNDLSKLCSKVTISETLYESIHKILDFYNIVLKWAMFTQQECNFSKNNLSFIDVLSILVTEDGKDFENSLRRLY